jgi:hypothetical protein
MRVAASRPRWPARLAPVLLLLIAAGCTGGPVVVKVNGLVTHKGKPVPSVIVNFEPDEGRPSWAVTDKEGRFVLSCFKNEDGALIGRHRVYLTVDDEGREEMAQFRNQRIPPAELRAILKKYGKRDTTPLRIEIAKTTRDLEIKVD